MAKFKIGDTVRVLADARGIGSTECKPGTILTVKTIGPSKTVFFFHEIKNGIFYDGLEKVEDTPKAKFKVGDKVKVIKKGSDAANRNFGKIITLSEVTYSDYMKAYYYEYKEEVSSGIWENELELADQDYKVGDKIRVIKNNGISKIGWEGKILVVLQKHEYTISFPDWPRGLYLRSDEIELIPENKQQPMDIVRKFYAAVSEFYV